jgi:penicillin-binding protein 1B
MTGRTFRLPSRVYSSPPVLYPGGELSGRKLRTYLDRSGYQRTGRLPGVGQYRDDEHSFEIGLRAFRDATGPQSARRVRIVRDGNRIGRIASLSGEQEEELPTLTLEPELLGEFFQSKREERTLLRLNDAPRALRDAILVMEDRDFYSHHGLSFRGTARALLANLRGGKVAQGGSTLTQQLMKNFFLTPERSLARKAREAVMTIVAEALYSKDQIFEAYVNEIYLGQRGTSSIHGFGEAARFYFSKRIEETTLGEQALLAGLISSPGTYSPYQSRERARSRRDLVLRLLLEEGKISPEAYSAAVSERIEPRGRVLTRNPAPSFVDFIRREIEDRFSKLQLAEEGFQIFTNLDPDLQSAASGAVSEIVPALEKRAGKGGSLQAALVSIIPQTGAIKAFVGGRDFGDSQFNRVVQASRQPGSAVKPFVYAAAIEEGIPATTLLKDRPTTFRFDGKDWTPRNYEGVYAGEVTLRSALERSLNVATVDLAFRVGLTTVSALFQEFGFENVAPLPSLALGTIEVTPLGLARAYTSFANGGLRTDPHGVSVVVDSSGHRSDQRTPKVKRVLSEETAFLTTYLLEGVIDRGTAVSARQAGLKGELAGKTGTTDDGRDSWFVGFSPSLLTVVWVGRDDGAPTRLTGASGALQIWIRFMKKAGFLEEKFRAPDGIHFVEIDRTRGCVGSGGEKIVEAFVKEKEPPVCE